MQKPCIHCKDGVNFLMILPDEGNGNVSLYLLNGFLSLSFTDRDENYNHKDLKISYCPMCGRKLSDTISSDKINHPDHYTAGKFEVIDVIDDWHLNYNLGNTLKYLGRADHKGTRLEDLRKGNWYLQREINKEEEITRMIEDGELPF